MCNSFSGLKTFLLIYPRLYLRQLPTQDISQSNESDSNLNKALLLKVEIRENPYPRLDPGLMSP
jgi:hypothetical protein